VTREQGLAAPARRCGWLPPQPFDRFKGIVSALLQEPPLALIGIEEPELTVHPGALPLLINFLRQASRRCQVVITTHSPELLDLLGAEEVRVVERKDGVTTVGPMRLQQQGTVRDGLLKLGELMVTEGLQQELEWRDCSIDDFWTKIDRSTTAFSFEYAPTGRISAGARALPESSMPPLECELGAAPQSGGKHVERVFGLQHGCLLLRRSRAVC